MVAAGPTGGSGMTGRAPPAGGGGRGGRGMFLADTVLASNMDLLLAGGGGGGGGATGSTGRGADGIIAVRIKRILST